MGRLHWLAGVLLVGALAGCQKETAQPSAPPVVWTVQPEQAEAAGQLRLTGRTTAIREAALGFQVAGRIAARHVEVGEHVKAGQVLMALDDRDYRLKVEALEAQIEATASDLKTARRDLRRLEDLLRRKLVSQQQVDNARNLVTKLKAQLSALQPQLQQARNQLTYTRLSAPFDGVVSARQADVGQVVGVGAPVLSVAGVERAVLFDWPETAATPPRAVKVTVGNETLEATLDYVSTQADPASRTYAVRYRLERDDVALGRSVVLTVGQPGPRMWRVPATAVRMEKGQAQLYIVADGKVQPVPVEVVRMDAEAAWVRGDLRGDMAVVSMGVHVLTPGQAVRARRDG